MKTDAVTWITRLLRYALAAVAVFYLATYLGLALLRLSYPFELEWMEGGSVDHVRRILAGRKLYVAPSIDFVPYIYTPLYFYLSALVSLATGVGFLPLRLVSLLSSLGCFAVIFLLVRRETASPFAGLLAAGLFAASFRLSGAWFDIARVDSLFLFFFLLALYALRSGGSAAAYALGAVLISLCFLTKQLALLMAAPVVVYCLLTSARRSLLLIGLAALLIGGSTLLLDRLHDGWYAYYVLQLPRQHPIVRHMFLDFWTRDLLSRLHIASALSLIFLVGEFSGPRKDKGAFYLAALLGMLAAAWSSRLHQLGVENVLMPAHAALAILFGLGAHSALDSLRRNRRLARETARSYEILIYAACIVQFAVLFYPPARQLPTRQDLDAGRRFINLLAQVEGEVYLPYHGYLPTLAGKRAYAHRAAVHDIMRGAHSPIREKLSREIQEVIRSERFRAIILDTPENWDGLAYYRLTPDPIFSSDAVFWPVTGRPVRPELMYLPREEAEG